MIVIGGGEVGGARGIRWSSKPEIMSKSQPGAEQLQVLSGVVQQVPNLKSVTAGIAPEPQSKSLDKVVGEGGAISRKSGETMPGRLSTQPGEDHDEGAERVVAELVEVGQRWGL